MEQAGEELQFVIQHQDVGLRLDHFLTQRVEGHSRSHLRRLLDQGLITVDGLSPKAGYLLNAGDIVRVVIPPTQSLSVEPEDIALDIIYEDSDIIVINKPAGMVVHPAAGNLRGTLVNALLAHCQDLSGIGGVHRPGIVHRLDKDTSGVMVAVKNDGAHRSLAHQIKDRIAQRWYLALVHGNIMTDSQVIDAPIARHPVHRKQMAVIEKGRAARTECHVRERFGDYTLVECRLETGRTHQIRVHLAYIKHPVVGDVVYGPKRNKLGMTRQALHAYHLGLTHPRTGIDMEFVAPLPQDLRSALETLRRRTGTLGRGVSKEFTSKGTPWVLPEIDKAGMR